MKIEERRYAETARDYARRILKANIVSMELEPGALVSENDLSAKLGLSRTPVREALMDLAKYQIVDVLPQRGSRIALIDYTLVEEARFTRQVLEMAILPLVCARVQPADLAQLRQNVRMQMLTQDPVLSDSLSLMELDDAFHRQLFHIAHMDNTYAMLGGMQIHFDRVRALALTVVRDSHIIEDHRDICEAIARGDAEEAKRLMKIHLERAQLDENTIRSACPQYIREAE